MRKDMYAEWDILTFKGFRININMKSTELSPSVIHQFNTKDPMKSEIALLGGAGTLAFDALKERAIKRLETLATMLRSPHSNSQDWANALNFTSINVVNDLRTIDAANNEFKKIRSRGGPRSKTIPKL